MSRVPAALALALALVAGCLSPLPDHPEEGSHAVAPPVGEGRQDLEVEGMLVQWRESPEDEPRELTWRVTHAAWQEGLFRVDAVGPSDEGWDFLFTLAFRVDGPHPVRLAFNESLARENTFNFTYREAVWWSGRSVDVVTTVDRDASWVDVTTWQREYRDVGGRFHLEFAGECRTECRDADAGPLTVVLDGEFPAPRRR